MSSGINIHNLQDATASASFSTNGFKWMGGNLTMTVYAKELYDTVGLSKLQVSDSILYSGDTIVVSKKEEKNGEIIINNGYDSGDLNLWPNEGGTYRAVESDGHSVYDNLGKVELPLNDDFTIVDCKDKLAPSTTINKNQKLYLERLKSYRQDISVLNTKYR